MPRFDPKTVERLARRIVDMDGPYTRTGKALQQLLEHSGWANAPVYDGTPKVPWLIEQMSERNNDSGDLERLVCRVCDPLEYDEGISVAQDFRSAINDILAAEQLVVIDTGGRPVLAARGVDGAESANAEPRELDVRVRRLIGDNGTADLLLKRAAEARICQRSGAYLMAVIAIGSLVEGLLYTVLTERDEDCRNHRFLDRRGVTVNHDQPSLAMLIDNAYARRWIQLDAKKFMHSVRDFRNYIHPRLELADNPGFDNDSVGLCWAPLQAMLNDLEQRFPAEPS